MDDIKLLALLHLAEAFAAGDISRDQYMAAIAKLHEEEGPRSLTKSWSAHDDDMIPLSQVGRHNFMDKSWSFLNTLSVSNRTFSIAKAFEFVDDLDDLLMLKASGEGVPVGVKYQGPSGQWRVKIQRNGKIHSVPAKAPEGESPAPTTPQQQSGTAAASKPRAKRKTAASAAPKAAPKPKEKAIRYTPEQAKTFIENVRSGYISANDATHTLANMSQLSINAIKKTLAEKIKGTKAQQAMSLAQKLLKDANLKPTTPKIESANEKPHIDVGENKHFVHVYDKIKKSPEEKNFWRNFIRHSIADHRGKHLDIILDIDNQMYSRYGEITGGSNNNGWELLANQLYYMAQQKEPAESQQSTSSLETPSNVQSKPSSVKKRTPAKKPDDHVNIKVGKDKDWLSVKEKIIRNHAESKYWFNYYKDLEKKYNGDKNSIINDIENKVKQRYGELTFNPNNWSSWLGPKIPDSIPAENRLAQSIYNSSKEMSSLTSIDAIKRKDIVPDERFLFVYAKRLGIRDIKKYNNRYELINDMAEKLLKDPSKLHMLRYK